MPALSSPLVAPREIYAHAANQQRRVPNLPNLSCQKKLLISLAQARNLHLKADSLSLAGNRVQARKTVEQILTLQFPQGAPEAEDIKNDARARIATMFIESEDFLAAQQILTEGFRQLTRDSFFVANLHTVQGQLLEAQAAKQTDITIQKNLRREAITAYERSQTINIKLQNNLDTQP